jgi:Flp pilus assembly CpaE family ATPase
VDEIILVIDPDAASLNFISSTLNAKGYKPVTAPSAKEGYIIAVRDQPALIIFDPIVTDLSGLELLHKLRQDRRTQAIPCIALSARSDPEEMKALLGAGCNEYIVKAGQAVQTLVDTIPRILSGSEAILPRKEGGYLVVFLSAKGGTGTSSLCANIAEDVARAYPEVNVAVADMVLPIGSIAPILGYEEALNLVSIAAAPVEELTADYLFSNLPRVPNWHFNLLAGSPDPDSANALYVDRVPDIVKFLQKTYDFIFVDLGRSLSRISLPIILDADIIVLVVASDTSTVTLSRTVWEYLRGKGVLPQRLFTILNRSIGLEGMSKQEAEEVIGLPIKITLPYMGGNFFLANNQNLPLIQKYPNDTAAMMINQIAVQINELAHNLRVP